MKSFRKYHPDWEMNLYIHKIDRDYGLPPWCTPRHQQDFHNYNGENYFDRVGELDVKVIQWDAALPHIKKIAPSQMSNFFKWRLLAKEGGFYSDMDILFFSPIEQIYNIMNDLEMDSAITHNGRYFSIGFMASTGSNDVFKGINRQAERVFNKIHYQGAGVQAIYKRWGHKDKSDGLHDLKKEFPNNRIWSIPMEDFYHINKLDDIFNRDRSYDLFMEGRGLHWYGGGVLAQEYNNTVNETNYRSGSSTIAKVLQYIEN